MVLRVRTNEVFYKPGEIATATTNAVPPYLIRCIVDGIVIETSTDLDLHVSILPEWVGGVVNFEVVKDGVSATTHAHVEE